MSSISLTQDASFIHDSLLKHDALYALDCITRAQPQSVLTVVINDLPCSNFRHYLDRTGAMIVRSPEALLLLHALELKYKKHGAEINGIDTRVFTDRGVLDREIGYML